MTAIAVLSVRKGSRKRPFRRFDYAGARCGLGQECLEKAVQVGAELSLIGCERAVAPRRSGCARATEVFLRVTRNLTWLFAATAVLAACSRTSLDIDDRTPGTGGDAGFGGMDDDGGAGRGGSGGTDAGGSTGQAGSAGAGGIGEICDDGNVVDGDGCSADCRALR